jgi:hypothetical protein
VSRASSSVHSANGFDNSAFGIFAAQLLAVPARIALAVVGGNLDDLAKEFNDAADRTKQVATTYSDRLQCRFGTADLQHGAGPMSVEVTSSNSTTGRCRGQLAQCGHGDRDIKTAHGADKAAIAVELGIGAASAVLDTVALMLDPLAKLISAGLGWLIEHVSFLRCRWTRSPVIQTGSRSSPTGCT